MSVYDLDLEQLTGRLLGWGEPAYRARQVYAGLWRQARPGGRDGHSAWVPGRSLREGHERHRYRKAAARTA